MDGIAGFNKDQILLVNALPYEHWYVYIPGKPLHIWDISRKCCK